MEEDRQRLLEDLKRNKRNRALDDVCRVLSAFGFEMRKTKKENSLWQRGPVTLTLPRPHGRDPILKTPYVSMVIREINKAEDLESASEGENEE